MSDFPNIGNVSIKVWLRSQRRPLRYEEIVLYVPTVEQLFDTMVKTQAICADHWYCAEVCVGDPGLGPAEGHLIISVELTCANDVAPLREHSVEFDKICQVFEIYKVRETDVLFTAKNEVSYLELTEPQIRVLTESVDRDTGAGTATVQTTQGIYQLEGTPGLVLIRLID